MDGSWGKTTDEVATTLNVNPVEGLSSGAVASSRAKYGSNEVPPAPPTPFFQLVLKQFEDVLVLILLAAAFISFLLAFFETESDRLTAFIEPVVILLILIANATVGVLQETNAEKAIEALKEMEAHDASVLRNGIWSRIPTREIVPGDVVDITVGDKVPADLRLFQMQSKVLTLDESLLTGESEASFKHCDLIDSGRRYIVDQDKKNIAFASTLVSRGKARGIVVATGTNTSLGKIQKSIDTETVKTPLQLKLDEFGEILSKIILWICIVVWLINIGNFSEPVHGGFVSGAIYYFKIAVALAVAAIPEGLPAVVTTCLALGTMKMAKRNAVVRCLPSVETLGCTSVICSDKTGTLTTNTMTAVGVYTLDERFTVSGKAWSPLGKVTNETLQRDVSNPASYSAALAWISQISSLCNESRIYKTPFGEYSKSGDSSEAALKVLAEKLGIPEPSTIADSEFISHDYWTNRTTHECTLEFTEARKSMSVVVSDGTRRLLLVKGATEVLVKRCNMVMLAGQTLPMDSSSKSQILSTLEEFSEEGLRCMAFAYRVLKSNERVPEDGEYEQFEQELVFVGFVGMLDPPRDNLRGALSTCKRAGIRVIMVTGDNRTTAISIARKIGLLSPGESSDGLAFTGEEFNQMNDYDKAECIRIAKVFARVEPHHKQEFVRVLQSQGEIVAMTGDGVNDAPALRKADIGVAMGSGTAVAREASDMVLQDDEFSTIVMAVEEGRAIYQNTRQFIRYLISSNIGEVTCIFITAALGIPDVLIPLQLLWVNLVTDGLPATALGFNKPDTELMSSPPRQASSPIIDRWMLTRYIIVGVYVGLATVLGYVWWYTSYESGPLISFEQLRNFHHCGKTTSTALFASDFDCTIFHDPRGSTVGLSILVTVEMFNALNALSENQSLTKVYPWSNVYLLVSIMLSFILHFCILYIPALSGVFSTAPLGWSEWSVVIQLSCLVIFLDEMLKFATRNTHLGSLVGSLRGMARRKFTRIPMEEP